MGTSVPIRDFLAIYSEVRVGRSFLEFKRQMVKVVLQIILENNKILLRKSRYYMYQLVVDYVRACDRDLSEDEQRHLLQNPKYIFDDYMSDKDIFEFLYVLIYYQYKICSIHFQMYFWPPYKYMTLPILIFSSFPL